MVLILTASECMFETSRSACLPLGGESAPTGAKPGSGRMRAIRGEPVEVWLRDGRPARFVWRGRMYTVIFVLERPLAPTTGPAAELPSTPADLPSPAPDGRECWRVEATPERTVPPTTYELCHDLTSDRWTLSRG
jgi:hypothetical protein